MGTGGVEPCIPERGLPQGDLSFALGRRLICVRLNLGSFLILGNGNC